MVDSGGASERASRREGKGEERLKEKSETTGGKAQFLQREEEGGVGKREREKERERKRERERGVLELPGLVGRITYVETPQTGWSENWYKYRYVLLCL